MLDDDPAYNITNGTICDPSKFKAQYPGSNSSCMFSKYKENNHLLRLQIVHLFGWLWGANFLIALGECTLAGAFASYYWAWQKPKVRNIPRLIVIALYLFEIKQEVYLDGVVNLTVHVEHFYKLSRYSH